MTWTDLIIFERATRNDSIFGDIWFSGVCYVWILGALGIVGYLVFAIKPRAEDVTGVCLLLGVGGMVWPVLLVVCLVAALIYGLRVIVHGDLMRALVSRRSRVARRDRRIRELTEANAKLERELELGED